MSLLTIPTVWAKGEQRRMAYSKGDEIELEYDGWIRAGVDFPPPRRLNVIELAVGQERPPGLADGTLILRTPAT